MTKLDFTAAKKWCEEIVKNPKAVSASINLAACYLKLVEENEDYKKALEFYGDLDNYDKENGSIHDMKPKGLERKLYRVLEFGERARAVLEIHREKM